MRIEGKAAVVTGAASGIGRALARRFAREGARGVAVADLRGGPLQAVADEIGGLAVPCDATDERAVRALVAAAEERFGPIDVFCSNAGVAFEGGEEAPDDEWRLNFDLHVMAHVYAARGGGPEDGGEGERVPGQHRLRGGAPHPRRIGDLRGDQARFGRLRRIPRNRVRRPRGAGLRPLPAGGPHRDDRGARAGGGERRRHDRAPKRSRTASSRRWRARSSSSCPIPRCSNTCGARPRTTTVGSRGCAVCGNGSRNGSSPAPGPPPAQAPAPPHAAPPKNSPGRTRQGMRRRRMGKRSPSRPVPGHGASSRRPPRPDAAPSNEKAGMTGGEPRALFVSS